MKPKNKYKDSKEYCPAPKQLPKPSTSFNKLRDLRNFGFTNQSVHSISKTIETVS